MPMQWSPGCGCCDPCKSTQIEFTPTSKYTRGGYSEWQQNFSYTAGDKFAHYRNSDGRVCEWEVPSDLTSGSGWTAAEEARYTFLEVIDYYDQVTEWHLYGSGWASLTDTELDNYLLYGKLAEGMGYVSKNDVLPSLTNFNAIFEFDINRRIDPYTAVSPPFKYQLFAAATLNGSNEPDDYFGCDVEWVEDSGEPIESNFSFSRPVKITMYRVVNQVLAETYDIQWTNSLANGPRMFCRRPDVTDGRFVGCVDLDATPTPTLSNITTPFVTDLYGLAFTVVNGPGSIAGTVGSLTVADGDVIQLDDPDNPTLAASWTIYSPGSTISQTDVLECGISTETPDSGNTITGLKIGVYIATGQPPDSGKAAYQSPDIINFARATAKLNGTITTCECQVCALTRQCPCEDDYEYQVFSQFTSTTDLTEYLTMWPTPSNSHGLPVTWTPVASSSANIGLLGTTTQRLSECSFRFMKIHAFDGKADSGIYKGRTVTYVWQYATLSILRYSGFVVKLFTDSEIRIYTTLWDFQTGTYPAAATVGDLITNLGGSIDDAWDVNFFLQSSFYFRSTSGSGESSYIDLEAFDCTSFTLTGTYDTDYHGGSPTNTWIGDEWTVQSA